MSALQVHVLSSIEQLSSIADRWDDLWQRSDVTCPQSRCDLICNWIRRFAPEYRFRAILVEQGDRLVAALPLVTRPWAAVVPIGGLPRNQWCGAGDLLVDPSADCNAAMRLLAQTLNKFPWIVYRFSFISCDSRVWQLFIREMSSSGCHVECRSSHDVTRIEIPEDWESYRQTWSSDHRHRIRRAQQRLDKQGDWSVERHVPRSADEAWPLLSRVMTIEDSGWKGREGTSILKTPNMAEFIGGMSESLTARRELEIFLLRLNDEIAAGEIVWNAKGVLHGYKVGYDEKYRRYSPGHWLMHEILREESQTNRCSSYDCIGPISDALRHWRGSTYRIGQITFATRRWASQALSFLYRRVRPARQDGPEERDTNQAEHEPIAARAEAIPLEHEVCDSFR